MYKKLQKCIIEVLCIVTPFCGIKAQATASTTLKASMDKGKGLYIQYCLTCHQPDGEGVPNLNPPLIKTMYVVGDKKRLITWVLKGSTGTKLRIEGKIYNNNMPPQNTLKDDEIAVILTYIRNSFGNKATAVTSAQVKAVRTVTN